MFLELRTYQLKPGTAAECERRFAEALPNRDPFSRVAGFWHSESGTLNRIMHLWPYDSLNQRMQVRADAVKSGKWPVRIRDLLVSMESNIIIPAAFSPAVTPRRLGTVYEICIDQYEAGGVDLASKAWEPTIARRSQLSPLVMCGHTEIGVLGQWVSIWAYRDMVHYRDTKDRLESIDWPPSASYEKLLQQDVVLARPAEFSDLH